MNNTFCFKTVNSAGRDNIDQRKICVEVQRIEIATYIMEQYSKQQLIYFSEKICYPKDIMNKTYSYPTQLKSF